MNRTKSEQLATKWKMTILGTNEYCETNIIDNELYVRGDICVYDDWFATGDLVELKGDVLYYLGRKA